MPKISESTESSNLTDFISSMTFASRPNRACQEMGCNHSHDRAQKQIPANHTLFSPPVRSESSGQTFGNGPEISAPEITLETLDQALANAVHITKKRLSDMGSKPNSQSNVSPRDLSIAIERKTRLESRLNDLQAIPLFLEANNLQFKGFKGWDKTNVITLPKRSNFSQFDSILTETKEGQLHEFPLDSRIRQVKGIEVDLINKPIPHNDHFHDSWVQQSLQSALNSSIRWETGQDEEGCPCCIAGLDFDEFAAAVKEISKSNSQANSLVQVAELNSASHWGLILGTAAPFGLIGLAAAIRNIKGSYATHHHLNTLIAGLDKDIQRFESQGLAKDLVKLKAFRNSLLYSRFDSKFNLIVPGVINGVASSLVLSTAFLAHPFALPAIALYATGQVLRNAADLIKSAPHQSKVSVGDKLPLIEGKQKVNQIEQSKTRFYAANTAGFVTFATGALLTFLSIPTFGIFGAGALTLPIGLALLSAGAISTGIMNNIWPRKFKPRNGDLGQARESWKSPENILLEISKLNRFKKNLEIGRSAILPNQKLKKFGLKILTAMPELKDFLPARLANPISDFTNRWLSFLPPMGSQATARKHHLNQETVKTLHSNLSISNQTVLSRISILETMTNVEGPHSKQIDENDHKALAQRSWDLLVKLKCQSDVIETAIQDDFLEYDADQNFPGLSYASENWIKFNFGEFLAQSTDQQLLSFNSATDFFLLYKLPKSLKYKQYGLNDYFWRWTTEIKNTFHSKT
jgi:hypothetical protein